MMPKSKKLSRQDQLVVLHHQKDKKKNFFFTFDQVAAIKSKTYAKTLWKVQPTLQFIKRVHQSS
jgi:DNA-binding transcriptional regulator GbsR (MarR family)